MCMYMNSFIILFVVLIVLLLSMTKKPQYSLITMILLSLLFFFMILNYKNYRENFANSVNIDNTVSNDYTDTWTIGPYSNLILPSNNTENVFPLLDPKQFGVYQGNEIPLKDNPYSKSIDVKDMLDPYVYPSVDGNADGLTSNFMFAYNQSSPLCCPSTFSTSGGCVCLTEAQKNLIGNRGTAYNK